MQPDTSIEEKNPLKQGLKQANTRDGRETACPIEEKNPLKQGLKLSAISVSISPFNIEEKNPLKQGLKLEKIG